METTIINIWNYVLILNPSAEETTTKFQITIICEQILIWCNITSVPVELERTIANWINTYQKQNFIEGASSIKEGDTQINFESGRQKCIDTFAVYFKDLLYRYRRLI